MNKITPSEEYNVYKRIKAREYLAHIRHLQNRIFVDMSEIAEMRENLDATGSFKMDGMPRNPNTNDDALLNAIVAIDSRCEKLQTRVNDYEKYIAECDTILESLTSHELAGVALNLHYLRGVTTDDIANKFHYTKSYIQTFVIGAGLVELYHKMPTTYRDKFPSAV